MVFGAVGRPGIFAGAYAVVAEAASFVFTGTAATLTIAVAGNDKLLLEDGASFLLLESGDFLLLE